MNMPYGQNKPNFFDSPCVRNCCLDAQDICLGCHRSLDEILAWHTMDEQQKSTSLEIIKQRAIAYKNR
ncbi:DUF1289 domain-containing protein [Shewanella polaris]|uniref:DUF1289 domain-containing protein n=1 Tax=Shewanella polaris TaxID=2588449 RepID=A0A4Y5YE69_9GAMM|nr:DUF1289 domain-containing protein [Shewanella polaris]QDE30937.1 DUF1289 domain-containing protein [Shewanella polaris]